MTDTVPFDRSALQRVVALINGKGGVGKTSLTANIGGILAAEGWKVLLVDLDFSGNLGADLGYYATDLDDDGASLFDAVMNGQMPRPIVGIRPNLDVLVGGAQMIPASNQLTILASQGGDALTASRLSIATMLAKIADDYQIVLLDCPPLDATMQAAALAAAKYLLVPAKMDATSLHGLETIAARIGEADAWNPELDTLGLVFFDTSTGSTRLRQNAATEMINTLGGDSAAELVFSSFISHAETASVETRSLGLLSHELEQKVRHAPKYYGKRGVEPAYRTSASVAKNLAKSHRAVALELIARIIKAEANERLEQ